MPPADDQASSSSGAAGQAEDKFSSRQCMEDTLDVLAVVGRGLKASADSTWSMVLNAVYPIKESVYGCADYTQEYLHPYLLKQPPSSHVPTFYSHRPPR